MLKSEKNGPQPDSPEDLAGRPPVPADASGHPARENSGAPPGAVGKEPETRPEFPAPDTGRYLEWYACKEGVYALERSQALLRELLSGWSRRSRSVLVFNAGSGAFLETLWDAGLAVTAQDNDPAFLARARAGLGTRGSFVLSAPDHLPFDDCSFDYAVAVAALEFWEDPGAVLSEIGRVACNGLILIFPNAWSLFGLECLLRGTHELCGAARPLLHSPRGIARLLKEVYGRKKMAWASALPGTSHSWRANHLLDALNALHLPLPVGAFAGVRVDFGPLYTGTPLLLRANEPAVSAK